MARPTLSTHPKFAKLTARLGGNRALARGVLELIWESCYASGEATVGDAESVEAIAGWTGARGELAAALAVCGFLDAAVHQDGHAAHADAPRMHTDANGGQLQYEVHDLEDHAPDYVLKRWEREAKRKAAGQSIRSLRAEAARVRWKQRAMQVSADVRPPAPAPAPAPTRDRRSERGGPVARLPSNERPARRLTPVALVTVPFLAVYDRYPNKDGRLKAAEAFALLADQHPAGETGLSREVVAWMESGVLERHPYKGDQRYRPSLETVITQQRWLDGASAPDDQAASANVTVGAPAIAAGKRRFSGGRAF